MAYMRCIPNLTIAAPRNEIELRNIMFSAQKNIFGPIVIRYPRGKGFIIDWKKPFEVVETGKGECLKAGKDIAILTIGTMAYPALKAIETVEKQTGESIALYDMRFVKPLDKELLHEVGQMFHKVITVEDGVINGGFGSAVLEFLNENGYQTHVKRLGVNDKFVEHGSPEELYRLLGLDADGIAKSIKETVRKKVYR